MHIFTTHYSNPVENIAADEALLEYAEATDPAFECLRIWEPTAPIVVIGRSTKPQLEVNLPYTQQHHIPVLRRSSGGATIVTGPGCLMYSVVLSYAIRPHLRMLDQAHTYVLETLLTTLQPHNPLIQRAGTSDLVLLDDPQLLHPNQPRTSCGQLTCEQLGTSKKFSGNSLRCKRSHFLYHGTLLYDFDLSLISRLLLTPPRQPSYRQRRSHASFLCNLPLSGLTLANSLNQAWQPTSEFNTLPQTELDTLITNRYLDTF